MKYENQRKETSASSPTNPDKPSRPQIEMDENVTDPTKSTESTESANSKNRTFQVAPRLQFYIARVAAGDSPKTAHKASVLWKRRQREQKESEVANAETGEKTNTTREDSVRHKSKGKGDRLYANTGKAPVSTAGKKRQREPTPSSEDDGSPVELPAEWDHTAEAVILNSRPAPPPPNPRTITLYPMFYERWIADGGKVMKRIPYKKPKKE